VAHGTSQDLNANGKPDECEIQRGTPFCFGYSAARAATTAWAEAVRLRQLHGMGGPSPARSDVDLDRRFVMRRRNCRLLRASCSFSKAARRTTIRSKTVVAA